ncbi:RNP domain protein [Aspergillus luchuensis]|uniref:RNP domain protein n=1 Tax=Aspergillus kawachii TaxID=1069201 RepID=A0A146F9Z6_ASPKA|nr:RNP domain protein [Aspergillus luchuensis]
MSPSAFDDTDHAQRERSRSPRRRSRSPRRSRRSYSPRSRSRSRDDYRRSDRRSRSPMSTTQGAPGGHSASGYGGRSSYPPPPRSFEDRAVAKEQMMQAVRESSQQDRRVYVGNLSYDVKWHHLKDFMRQGEQGHIVLPGV